jgi:cytochrome c
MLNKMKGRIAAKKTIVIFSLAAFLYACGGGETKKTDGGGDEKTTAAADPDVEKGLALVGQSDCGGCHKPLEPSVGPAHADVAKKYENTEANINMLADKIVNGGSGNWGTVPMAAHPGISKADAVLMAKYVLSLKDAK